MEAIPRSAVCCTPDGAQAVLHLATRYADAFQQLGQLLAAGYFTVDGAGDFHVLCVMNEKSVIRQVIDSLCLRGDKGAAFVEQLKQCGRTRHALYWYLVVAADVVTRSKCV